MAQRSLRFGIQDGAGCRAATWKVWTELAGGKADVYLACRALGGTLKASLHESGRWHIAYSPATFEQYVAGAIPNANDRFIEKWPRPPEIAPGVTLAFRIVTPWSATTHNTPENICKELVWIPNAPAGEATEIDVFLISAQTLVTDWPGKRGMGTSLIGSFQLESGESVWIVYRTVPMPDFDKLTQGIGRFYKGKSKNDLEGDGLRALLFGTAEDGSRVVYDCAVQPRSEQTNRVGQECRAAVSPCCGGCGVRC